MVELEPQEAYALCIWVEDIHLPLCRFNSKPFLSMGARLSIIIYTWVAFGKRVESCL